MLPLSMVVNTMLVQPITNTQTNNEMLPVLTHKRDFMWARMRPTVQSNEALEFLLKNYRRFSI